MERLLQNDFKVNVQGLLLEALDKVCQGGGSVGPDSFANVVHNQEKFRDDHRVVFNLEFGLHVVANLPNCVAWGVPEHFVVVFKVAEEDFHDWIDFLDLLDVFSDLGKRHHGGVLVAPVVVS